MTRWEDGAFVEMGHREFRTFEYALVNPMQLEAGLWQDLPTEPLHANDMGLDRKLLPRLVSLASLSEVERAALLQRNDQWMRGNRSPLFGALMHSKCGSGVLRAHLSRQMKVVLNKQRYWLRFHDPRVFTRLSRLFNDEQLRCLLGPVDVWAWFDAWVGAWCIRRRPLRHLNHMPARLEVEQCDALHRLPLLNRCLSQLARGRASEADPSQLAKRLDGGLQEATSLGLVDRDDACFYAISIERHGAAWRDREYVRRAMLLAAEGKQTFVSACVEIERGVQSNAVYDSDHL